ncbi:hypothetical protein [Aliagarivorans marinus]|uniref:hypothetical protein n=1 Tax=Aliagarivorans marinus TaxID=561965 RepID=UPI00047A54AD|nr:hypothetical protein [Aliagarivorans marinus]
MKYLAGLAIFLCLSSNVQAADVHCQKLRFATGRMYEDLRQGRDLDYAVVDQNRRASATELESVILKDIGRVLYDVAKIHERQGVYPSEGKDWMEGEMLTRCIKGEFPFHRQGSYNRQ